MPIEKEAEIRALVASIASWRTERDRLTAASANIVANPAKVYLKGKNPSVEIAELKSQILKGNQACESSKVKLRGILSEILSGFRTSRDATLSESYKKRRAAAEAIRAFSENWDALANLSSVNHKNIAEFNTLVSSIELAAVEDGENKLPRADESLNSPRRPTWDFDLVRSSNVEKTLQRMAESLSL